MEKKDSKPARTSENAISQQHNHRNNINGNCSSLDERIKGSHYFVLVYTLFEKKEMKNEHFESCQFHCVFLQLEQGQGCAYL